MKLLGIVSWTNGVWHC